MQSQQDRLQSKIERLKERIEAERKAAGPKIAHRSFEADDYMPDGTIKPKVAAPATRPLIHGSTNPIFGAGVK